LWLREIGMSIADMRTFADLRAAHAAHAVHPITAVQTE